MCVYLEKKLMDYRNHISCSEDLITSYSETRAGFISIALEKNRMAAPFINEARALQCRIKNIKDPNELLQLPDIRNGLIAASGISDKAAAHLGEDGCAAAIQKFVENFLVPAGDKFREELVFRFLLTKGDSLGGKMRNIVGMLAQKKLCLAIISALRLANIDFHFLLNGINQWISSKTMTDDLDAENAKGLSWEYPARGARTLYFNITVPAVKNNIDIILLNKSHAENIKEIIEKSDNYMALGELKGGIDPSGADEHWKTAKTALDRIKDSFAQRGFYPDIFFISAAIENKMAKEIYANLETGYINNAANLTKPDHITSLVAWLLEK